jgi:monoamine oxidase
MRTWQGKAMDQSHSAVLTRRMLLVGLAATPAALAASRSWSSDSEVDVVIVGAGAAGIGAAIALANSGLKYTIVEAADRVGGRALTDSKTFLDANQKPIPFDIGCAWIHRWEDASDPFRQWSERLKFETYDHDLAVKALFYGPDRAGDAVVRQLGEDEEKIGEALTLAADQNLDIAGNRVVVDRRPPMDAAATYVGPMDAAVDLEHLSTFDHRALAEYGKNRLVKQGYGTLVRAVAAANRLDAPGGVTSLRTPVQQIRYDRPGSPLIQVETGGAKPGAITARAVIVTCSTGVLQSGAIRFTPDLPVAHQEAIGDLRMGLLAKIPLQLPGVPHDLGGIKPYDNVLDEQPGDRDIYFLAWPWQSDLMVGFVGGDFAWQMSAEGQGAAIDFATQRLADIFGADIRKKVTKGLLTPWASNPLAYGAYAAATPGAWRRRADLETPVKDRVFFAGEAVAPGGMYGTCSGAYSSGMKVAQEVTKTLKPA